MEDKNIVEEIKCALNKINKELQLHEGAVAFLDFKDGVLYIELEGACCGCPESSCGTIPNFEQKLKSEFLEIKKVVVI